MKLKTFYLLILSFIVFSCKTQNVAANQKVNIIEVVKSQDVTLVDVRIPEQFAEATAENAINIPLAEIENRSSELKGKKVVVFCNKGIQADQAVEILKKKGVEVYDGTSLQNLKAIQNLKN